MPDQIDRIAADLLTLSPDPIPKFKIMKDLLNHDFSPVEIEAARFSAMRSPLIISLVESQLPDGSWGSRFHNFGDKISNSSNYTETAIVRLQSLGVDRNSDVLVNAINYMEDILASNIIKEKSMEKHDYNNYELELIIAARLREIIPEHPLALAYAEKMKLIIKSSFSKGDFDEALFMESTEDIMGTRPSPDCKICFSIYPLVILRGLLEYELEQRWIYHLIFNRRGINMLNNRSVQYLPLSFPSAESLRYIQALDYLSWYPSATEYLIKAGDWLWNQMNNEGLWDFGKNGKDGLLLPLSENWRSPRRRQIDSTIRVLSVLRRLQTSCSIRESICHPI